MYFRNIIAAASFIAMVASAALPEPQSTFVPGFEKSCIDNCKATGSANENCYGWCPQCDASQSSECLPASSV